jgi:hypothetical protein
MSEVNRRLAGILAADVVGYSAMVGKDEPGTLARVPASGDQCPLISNQVSKGFEQLASDKITERLGGIYALEARMLARAGQRLNRLTHPAPTMVAFT